MSPMTPAVRASRRDPPVSSSPPPRPPPRSSPSTHPRLEPPWCSELRGQRSRSQPRGRRTKEPCLRPSPPPGHRSAARRGFLSFTGWHFLNAFTISRLRLKHLLEASSDFLKISSADSPQKHEECCGRVALAHTWGAAEAGRAGLSQRPRPRVATRSRAEELPAGSTSFLGGSGWEGKREKKENLRKKGEKKPKQNNFSRSNNELEKKKKNQKARGAPGTRGSCSALNGPRCRTARSLRASPCGSGGEESPARTAAAFRVFCFVLIYSRQPRSDQRLRGKMLQRYTKKVLEIR